MSRLVELNLALVLFLPWLLILGALFWIYPRQRPRTARRRWFDAAALAVSVAAFVLAMHWGHAWADRGYGHMWQQVVATSVAYGTFLAALGGAFWLRRRLSLG